MRLIYCIRQVALVRSDFDLDARKMTINKSYQRLEGKDYITSPKTKRVTGLSTCPNFCVTNWQIILGMLYGIAMKKGNNFAHHIIHSFSTKDNITLEKAPEIGGEFMRRMFHDYQYVIAVHLDCEHTHVHIVMNAVNFRTHKKLHCNHKTLEEMRRISDELCAENGFIVITPEFRASRKKMKANIDKFVKESSSFDEFLEKMQERGCEMRYDKYLAFRADGSENFFRVDMLGTAYEENELYIRCANKVSPQNKRKLPYTKILAKPMSKAKHLMWDIDLALHLSKDFDGFLLNENLNSQLCWGERSKL